jgi:membrane fusion protein (multidrug efflux system)
MAEVADDGADSGRNGAAPAGGRGKRFVIFGLVLLVSAVAGGVYWWSIADHETTDDAFIDADVVQIAPQVAGPVTGLHFTDNQWVESGALLLEIDPRDYEVALASARADLDVAMAQQKAAEADLNLMLQTTQAAIDEAKEAVDQAKHQILQARQQSDASRADAERAGADASRYEELVKTAIASRQRYEQAMADARGTAARWRATQLAVTTAEAQEAQAKARLADANAAPQRIAGKQAQLATSRAQVERAAAAVRQAELNLSYTRIVAPRAGRMAKRAVNVGDLVQKNQNIAALVADPPWVTANFKETQLARMRPGQPVVLTVDAFRGHQFRGRVDSVQAGTGSRFSLLPAENATGNYVKVVQRVPVKIVFETLSDAMVHQLAPGMSVVPDVDVGDGASGK